MFFTFGRSALGLLSKLWLVFVLLASAYGARSNEVEETRFSPNAAALYKRASQVSPPPGADVIFVEDEETVVFNAEGKAVRTRYTLYKILTQKGASSWTSISTNWAPWHEERPSLRARVISPDSSIHTLDSNTIADTHAEETHDNIFSNWRVLRAPLPAITPGALVEEEEVLKESAPLFGAGTVERFYFAGSVPIEHTKLVLDAPATLSLRYDVRLLPGLKTQRTEDAGRVRIEFENGPIDAVEEIDPELPNDVSAYASVTFSTGDSWKRIAEEYGKIVDSQLAGSNLKSQVLQIVGARRSREDKAEAILQYVDREVRYTGLEFGDATIVPRSPTETLTRKYGDCKDKAALLVAMLRAAGIPAYVALLNAGSREEISRELPGMGMFDHAIVYVPGGPDLWIDATDDYARVGDLPRSDQGRYALITRPTDSTLVTTPVSSSAYNALVEKREVYLADNGPARIIETSQPHGSTESSYRRSYGDKENKKANEELENYVKVQYLAEKLDRLDRSDARDLFKPFELILESDRARRGSTELDAAVAAIRLESLFDRLPANLRQREKESDPETDKPAKKAKKERTADYQLPEAFVTEWRYSIVPPQGFQPKPLPRAVDIALGPCKFSEEFSVDKDRIVHATIRFDTVKRRLTVAEAHELRDKIVQLLEGEPIVLYFEPIGQTLLNQGKVREALASYHDLIALHPKEAVHHLQLSQALLAAGLGEPARSEAKVAVELEPKSALANKTLADILEYDSVGRKFRPGSDYVGAEAAFRIAIALDPDDQASIANLAVLLEFNRWGLRRGPGARLKDALAEYGKLKHEKLVEWGMQDNVSFDLFYDGQFAEAQQAAETLNPQPLPLIVACEAALKGSQAALAKARQRTAQEDQFKQTAASAGQMLINIRKYSVGADLEEAGASGSDASDTIAYASLYRKTVPREQLQLSDNPADVAIRVELIASDPAVTIDQLRSIASRNGAKAFAIPQALNSMVHDAKGAVIEKARDGHFADVGLDISITRAQPKVQGSDAIGYKVTLWPSAKYKNSRYIVKEDGHYKVLGFWRNEGIGLEILDRVAANDLAGGRVLLDWLREDQHIDNGDDPLAGRLFPRFWTKGQDADAASMKVAAAAILSSHYATVSTGVAILENALKAPGSDAERANIMLVLAHSYDLLENYEKSFAVRTALAKQHPESESLFGYQGFNLRALRRFDEADALAEDRLKRIPGDLEALRSLARSAAAQGDYRKAQAWWEKIIDSGQSDPQDMNSSSWNSLYTGNTQPADLENALKAAQLSGNSANILNTLACVYAELGKTKEAHEVLIQGMDSQNLDEPEDDYWYGFGRIAEQYGEREAAIADYNHIKKPEQAAQIPTSSYRLAQLRLEVLEREKR